MIKALFLIGSIFYGLLAVVTVAIAALAGLCYSCYLYVRNRLWQSV